MGAMAATPINFGCHKRRHEQFSECIDMKEWKEYAVDLHEGVGSNQTFIQTVDHTCHADAALSILSTGRIRPGLVFDKSNLNDRRILVSWVSPNYWSYGFRYGNVRFKFDFKKLIEERHFYWVEVIKEYSPHACRILITDKDYNGELLPYDPACSKGPWRVTKTEEIHFFKGDICLELMIEADIALDHLVGFDFVQHHPHMCSVHSDRNRCDQLGLYPGHGGATFISRAVARGQNLSMLGKFLTQNNGGPNSLLQSASEEIMKQITPRRKVFTGSTTSVDALAAPLARAAMGHSAFGRKDDAKALCSLFKDMDELEEAVEREVGELLGIASSHWQDIVP
jgi:hypothetical protein